MQQLSSSRIASGGCNCLSLLHLLQGTAGTEGQGTVQQCPELSITSIRASYMKPLWGILEIDIYEAIMKQISIIFSKNEVVGAAIFGYCQTTIKL